MANGADPRALRAVARRARLPSLGKLGMASFFIASLFLAGHGGRPPPHQARRSREATSSAHASIRESDPQHAPVVPKAGCNMTRDGDGVCYPASYGSSNCAAHDLPLTPECTRLDEAERPLVVLERVVLCRLACELCHVQSGHRTFSCAPIRPLRAPSTRLAPAAVSLCIPPCTRRPRRRRVAGLEPPITIPGHRDPRLRNLPAGTHTLTVRGPPVAIPPGAPQAP